MSLIDNFSSRSLPRVGSASAWSEDHILAVDDFGQDRPAVITRAFDGIASLMNGAGPSPGGLPSEDEGEGRPADQVQKLLFYPGTVLRIESFGGILYTPQRHAVDFVNRPGAALLRSNSLDVLRDDAQFLSQLSRYISNEENAAALECIDYTKKRYDALSFPVSATMELTFSCHHACKHCMNSSSPKRDRTGELHPDVWIAQLAKLRQKGMIDVYFSGGEISRYDGYGDVLQACDDLGISYLLVSDLAGHSDRDFEILTNARNLTSVRVSLDGHIAEQHDFLRGQGAFQKTIRGIERLISAKVPVGIYHSVHTQNLPHVDAFVSFCNDMGIRDILTGVACPIGRGETALARYTLDDERCAELTRTYVESILSGRVRPMNRAWNLIADAWERNRAKPNVFATWRDFAHGGTHRIHLAPNGDIRLCPKLESTKYSVVGNIAVDDMQEVWDSPLLNELRGYLETENMIAGVRYLQLQQ